MQKFYNPFKALFTDPFSAPSGHLVGDDYYTYLFAPLSSDLGLTRGTGTATFTRASSQYYTTADGYLDKVLSGVPAFESKGFLSEPASTSLFLGRAVPRADSYGAVLTSGTAAKGKIYEIVTRTSIDWSLIGTLQSGTANTVGAKYLVTGALTFTASDTAKESYDYVGTKSYHDGTAFIQNITGMTLSSAGVNPVLSIVADQAAVDAAKLGRVTNAGKMYDCTTGASSAVITFTGLMTAVASSFQQYVRVLSGSCVISDSAGANTITPTGATYVMRQKENFVAVAGRQVIMTIAPNSQIRFSGVDLEAMPFCTSWKPSEGATAARADVFLSVPLSGNMPLTGRRFFSDYWTPKSVIPGRTEFIAGSVVDASNYVKLASNGVIIFFEKRVAGVSEFVTFSLSPVAGVTYRIEAWFNSDNTMGLRVGGVSAGVGLGAEKVVNGGFDAGATGWTLNTGWSVINGVLTLSAASASFNQQLATFDVNTKYEITVDVLSISGSSLSLRFGNSVNTTSNVQSTGTKKFSIAPTVTGAFLGMVSNAIMSAEIDNISVREIYNNSTTLAPIFGSQLYIGSDGTNPSFAQYQNFKITN